MVKVEPLREPMHVAVLIDAGAIAAAAHQSFRNDVADFVDRLAAFNHVAIYSFGDNAVPVLPFTKNQAQLRHAVTMMVGQAGRSSLLDAVTRALDDMKGTEMARPVIIAITTLSPEASGASAGSVLKKLANSSTAFHAITLGAAGTGTAKLGGDIPTKSAQMQGVISHGEGERERERVFKDAPVMTGGSVRRITNTLGISEALARLHHEMSNSYKVSFTRPGGDRIKDLQVGVMLEGVTLRATAAPFGTR